MCLCVYVMVKCIEGVLCIQWQFQSCQVTWPGDTTHTAEPLCHSWISTPSSKHNWPEFYLGNAWACPGLEPPMYVYPLSVTLQLLHSSEKGKSFTIFCSLHDLYYTHTHNYVLCVWVRMCWYLCIYVVMKCIEGVLCINSLSATLQLLYNFEKGTSLQSSTWSFIVFTISFIHN